MKQIYECYIKTLAPLHIGCDEVYEPTGFVVDETKKELVSFDPIDFISRMDAGEKQRFSAICTKGTVESILEIYKFLKGKQADGKRVQLCAGFVNHYNKTIALPINDKRKVQQELGKFAVSRTSFLSGDERPYIPGSAVKGSLRTAFLNAKARRTPMSTPGGRNAANDLEKNLLNYNDLANDPFRLVKVSDFMPVGEIATRIVYAVDVKKAAGEGAKGPPQILEIILPGAVFRGAIVVEEPLTRQAVREPIQLDVLIKSGGWFYDKEFNREKMELQPAGVQIPDGFFSKNAMPIRIGRHSGAESVTIEGHRKIKILAGKGKQPFELDHATTVWLASENARPQNAGHCKPFGWAELCELTPSFTKEFENREKEWRSNEAERKPAVSLQFNGGITEKSSISQPPPPEMKKAPDPEIWEKAVLSYAPNTQTVSAKWEGKNAATKDISLLPEALLVALKKKKKTVTAKVTAEFIGGREYRLVGISE
ncbi:MAG: type III-A CRISPR-associated RAMP protein Csm5 [Desulfosalsimonadaceae bacterium]